jgi:hypothetical protein
MSMMTIPTICGSVEHLRDENEVGFYMMPLNIVIEYECQMMIDLMES